MPIFQKVSTLKDNAATILGGVSTTIIVFTAVRFLIAHHHRKMNSLGVSDYYIPPVGVEAVAVRGDEITLTFMFLFLILMTSVHYERNLRSYTIYGAKLLFCYAMCFVVSDAVIPWFHNKESVLSSSIAPFLTITLPYAVFWFILLPHVSRVWDKAAGYQPRIQRGASSTSLDEIKAARSGTATEATCSKKHIRIVTTPDGFSPKDIREQWVGVVIPLEPDLERPQKLGGVEVYNVDARQAIEALSKRSPSAARWWRDNAPDLVVDGGLLGFQTSDCELLGNEITTPKPVASSEEVNQAKPDALPLDTPPAAAAETSQQIPAQDEDGIPDLRRLGGQGKSS